MATKTIVVCDGCGKELKSKQEKYKLCLKTDRFWDGVEYDYLLVNLEFCQRCALDIKTTLIKIANKGVVPSESNSTVCNNSHAGNGLLENG